MPDLDDPQAYILPGTAGMLRHLHDFPSECERAWNNARRMDLPREYGQTNHAVVCGMGGSAIGGDLAKRLALLQNMPVLVHRDYGPVHLLDRDTLLIFSSYSGNTEETLSCFTESIRSSARKLVISTGGRLGELASHENIPMLRIDYQAPPRAAFPHSFMSLLGILDKLGLLEVRTEDFQEAIASAVDLAGMVSEETPVRQNAAKQVAQRLHNRLGVIYGAGLLTEVAQRWKTQLNENSKSWAFSESLPELDHNAVVGYELPGEIGRRAHVLLLHSSLLHPRISLRYRLTAELISRDGISYEFVEALGNSALAQMLRLVLLGDYVSFYLAVLNGVDPTTVVPIDYLKSRLADSPTS
jgi:glucose/mannose-6-phosphate isomerase